MKPLAEPALQAVLDGRTKIIPESVSKIYCNWLENIQDWCVSRQLWWGHLIPAYYTPDGTIIVARDEAEARERLLSQRLDPNTPLTPETDVLDTWFSSQLWPFSTLGWPEETEDLKKYYPTDVLVTAQDIIFFWVARMMMMGLKFMGEVPFRTVYINALVLDPNGQKMSKTKGNVIDPLDVFAKYGTDAARFALTAASTTGLTLALQESKLESARNFANKIWNATRFVLLNCGDILEDQEPLVWETELSEPSLADRWILSRLNAATAEVNVALQEYRFHEAAATLYQFFWNEFCDWYIELSKPFVTSTEKTDENTAVKRRIIYILERSLSLLHPLMPYITEELWQRLPHRGKTICLNEFPTADARDEQAEREMELFTGLVSKLRNIRSTFNIAPSVSINAKVAATEATSQAVIAAMSAQIKRLARIENLEMVATIETQKGSVRDVINDIEIAVPLEGLVDFEKEKGRLETNATKSSKELESLQKRLSNADFVARAAAEVVAESRARAAELEEQISKLKAMIEAM